MELLSTKDRVRNFIDDRHWGEDGRYKEIILKDCIHSKLPDNVKIGTGFVVGDHNAMSTQIDIIIYRAEIPTLFQKDDFVIVPQEAVLGIIEVKTKLDSSNITEAFRKSHENGRIIGSHVFNGIFSFEGGFQLENNLALSIRGNCEQYAGYINNVSFNKNYFMKYWMDGQPNHEQGCKYKIYKIDELSFGYFISNLIEDIYLQTQQRRLPDGLKRMFYPIENTKEAYTQYTIPIDGE